jgi:hypothetical protein
MRSPDCSLETLVAIARLTAVETLEWVATMHPATLGCYIVLLVSIMLLVQVPPRKNHEVHY